MTRSIIQICFVFNATHGIARANMMNSGSDEKAGKVPLQVGFNAEVFMNGDAHGTFYSAGVSLKQGRMAMAIGPCLQNRSQEINSGKISFSYLLSGIQEGYSDETGDPENDPDEVGELRMLFSLQYIHKAPLSYCASRIEALSDPENAGNYAEARLSTVTATLGPELGFYLKKIRVRTYAGVSLFHHCNYLKGMFLPRTGPALVLGIGLRIPTYKKS